MVSVKIFQVPTSEVLVISVVLVSLLPVMGPVGGCGLTLSREQAENPTAISAMAQSKNTFFIQSELNFILLGYVFLK
jgi:hypothetical protein